MFYEEIEFNQDKYFVKHICELLVANKITADIHLAGGLL